MNKGTNGTSVSIYTISEKEFIKNNPLCKNCLVQSMCIRPIRRTEGISVRVCEELYTYFKMVKKNDKNLINFNKEK